jgi:hypothetical protein
VSTLDRLAGLSEQERGACLIAERCLGVTAEPWDTGGRRGVVDALLHFPDGRVGAFEVTVLASEGALQTENLLARDNHQWPSTGKWHWTINIGSPRDIPRLKKVYPRIVAACEAAGAPFPSRIAWGPDADEDVRWLVQESTSSMLGHSGVKARAHVMVVPTGGGGAVDDRLEELAAGLSEAFKQPHIEPHFEKLERADADERHLFIPLHQTALPDSVALGLMFDSETLPPNEPPVPGFLTHLWLAPRFSRRVLVWARESGWCNYFPYN